MHRFRAAFLLSCTVLIAATASAATVYAVFDDAGTNTYGTLDMGTGVFSPIATQTPNLYGMGFAPNGNLYGTDSATNAGVYQVDPLTGNLTNLGTSTNSVIGSTVGSDGLIYAVSQDSNGIFYTINPTTVATNVINTFGFQSDGLSVFADGIFYTDLMGPTDDTLEAVDPITGVATAVGTGLGVQIFAGVDVNGTIYGGDGAGNLYTINLSSGVATLVAAVTGATGGLDALAFQPVPEPPTASLAGIAFVTICLFKLRC
ncbi:MAG TPA: hypothetical protein VNU44_08625 [Bryobacteraceae bacterium]|jgi:hypothetical protein|nr:hypothetical protein [Bryobacteraceae bacterium]